MDRRSFLKATTGLVALSGTGLQTAKGFIPAHN